MHERNQRSSPAAEDPFELSPVPPPTHSPANQPALRAAQSPHTLTSPSAPAVTMTLSVE